MVTVPAEPAPSEGRNQAAAPAERVAQQRVRPEAGPSPS
jgi:hypothetical protein